MMALIELRRRHDDFDLASELLATLPIEPYWAHGLDIAEDLGLRSQYDILGLCSVLRKRGLSVDGWVHPGCGNASELYERPGPRACILRRGFVLAQMAAEEYWAKVYGE